LDEWLLAGWQPRPHDALRDPLAPRRMLSPNEKYAALVAAAGYLPLTLTGEDYLELLPVEWRQINAYGIRIGYRTYDCPELGGYRLQHSGVTARRGLWEVHHDPYDVTKVFVRTPDGWVAAPWTHLPMVSAPFAEFTWRHARKLTADRGLDDTNETEVARVLDELLTRAQAGPADKRSGWVTARGRVAAATHRPPSRDDSAADAVADADNEAETPLATVIRSGSSTPTLRRPGGERGRPRPDDRRGAADHQGGLAPVRGPADGHARAARSGGAGPDDGAGAGGA
jgi:Mu transposase, C-terminal